MRVPACLALLLLLSACATSAPSPREPVNVNPRVANLRRAASLPWNDEGRCAVQEASHPWPVLVERCFQALDHEKLRFRDPTGRCAVASTGTAVMGIGLCILAAPEIVVGAVVVTGVVVIGVAIKAALDSYEPPQTKPATRETVAERKPKPEPSGQDWLPPVPPGPLEQERRPDCTPRPAPRRGGNDLHNRCADRVPQNHFPGSDVLVNGKNFDALQWRARVLWEVKTTAIETYTPYVRRVELDKQIEEARRERDLAAACGHDFRVGVLSEAHQELMERAAPDLEGIIVVMDWC